MFLVPLKCTALHISLHSCVCQWFTTSPFVLWMLLHWSYKNSMCNPHTVACFKWLKIHGCYGLTMSIHTQCTCQALWYLGVNNCSLYIYIKPHVLQIGVIMSDYPQKSLHVAHVCRIYVITNVHKYKDYMCAVVGLCHFKCMGMLPFCSTLNFLLFLWPRHERREKSTWQYLYFVAYLFLYVCLVYGLCF